MEDKLFLPFRIDADKLKKHIADGGKPPLFYSENKLEESIELLSACIKIRVVSNRYRIEYAGGIKLLGTLYTLYTDGSAERLPDCTEVLVAAVSLGRGADELLSRVRKKDAELYYLLNDCAESALADATQQLKEALQAEVAPDRFVTDGAQISADSRADVTELLQTEKYMGVTVKDGTVSPRKTSFTLLGMYYA